MSDTQDNLAEDIKASTGFEEHKPSTEADVVKLSRREKERAQTKGYDTWSLADAEFKPNTNYLVKGLINPSSTSAFYGEWGTGKSFVVLDLCFHISQGLTWLGRKVKKANTLYVALEGGGGIENRAVAIKNHYIKEEVIDYETDLTSFRILTPPTFYLAETNKVHRPTLDKLIVTVKENKIKFIVIDTLAQALGGSNENNEGMLCILNACRELAFECDCHVSVVHHPPKNNTDDLRGHSSLAGSLDLMMKIKKDKNDKENKDIITLETAKVKDDTDDNKMVAKLKSIKLGTDDDGDDVFSLVATHFEGEYIFHKKEKSLTKNEVELWNALKMVAGRIKPERFQEGKPPHHFYVHKYPRKETTIELVKDGFYYGNAPQETEYEAPEAPGEAPPPSGKILSDKERNAFGKTLNQLQTAGKIVCDKYYWWIVDDNLNGEEEDNQPF